MATSIRKLRNGPRPDMNVTPLVDVVLVLLIIFMVVAPQMDKNVVVDLPGVFLPDPEVKDISAVAITVAPDGSLWIDEQPFEAPALTAHLEAVHKSDVRRRAVIRADRALAYAKVRDVFALVKDVGFPGVSLMVSEIQGASDVDDASKL